MKVTDSVSLAKASISFEYLPVISELTLRMCEVTGSSELTSTRIVLKGADLAEFFGKVGFLKDLARNEHIKTQREIHIGPPPFN